MVKKCTLVKKIRLLERTKQLADLERWEIELEDELCGVVVISAGTLPDRLDHHRRRRSSNSSTSLEQMTSKE